MTGLSVGGFLKGAPRAAALIAIAAVGAVLALIGVGLNVAGLAFAGVVVAIAGAAGFALHLIVTERRRHEVVEEELSAESSFLEALVESMRSIASTLDPEGVLERTRNEAEDLFGAEAAILPPGESPPGVEG